MSCTGPKILLYTFLSKTFNCFLSLSVSVQVYDSYVNVYKKYRIINRDADKSLARPGRRQARKHVRESRDFNNIETRAVIKFFFSLQGNAPKEIHAIRTETLACFLPRRTKDVSASLYFTGEVVGKYIYNFIPTLISKSNLSANICFKCN